MEDANRINYLAMFYCNNKVLMVVAGVAWMILLFVIMTITAEIFLCPAIEVREIVNIFDTDIPQVINFIERLWSCLYCISI
jgi:hypothetical protein